MNILVFFASNNNYSKQVYEGRPFVIINRGELVLLQAIGWKVLL